MNTGGHMHGVHFNPHHKVFKKGTAIHSYVMWAVTTMYFRRKWNHILNWKCMIYSESELYCKPGIIACAAVSFIFNLLCFIYASPGASVISHVYAFIQNKNHDITFFICSLKLSKTVRFKPWLTNETEDGFKMLFFFICNYK